VHRKKPLTKRALGEIMDYEEQSSFLSPGGRDHGKKEEAHQSTSAT